MSPLKKILILSANPKNTARLRLDEEVREIEEGLRRSKCRDQFVIHSKWAVLLRDIRRALLDYEPQIVHFCGYGEKDGLKVEDDDGNAILVPADALSGLFELFAEQIECVLLNACYSAAQAKAINKHINYVIGMSQNVEYKTVIEFAVGFYDALGAGKSVKKAFKFGCNAIQLYNIPGHLVPLLLEKKRAEPPMGEKIEEPADPGGKSQKELPFNPFGENLAIREPTRFIGREAEMNRLLEKLRIGSVALMGEPKIGKSSILWRLLRIWNSQIIGPLDCLTLDGQEDFYERIAEALELEGSGWRSIYQELNSRKLLLLLDELDTAPEQGLTNKDLSRFRAVSDSNRDFKMVAVSRTPLKEVFLDIGKGSPGYNFLQPLIVGPLNEREARQLLNHSWAPDAQMFDGTVIERLVNVSECHPFKLQRAAFHCYIALSDPLYDWETEFQQDMEQML